MPTRTEFLPAAHNDDDFDTFGTDTARSAIARFRSPMTRMLLGSDGLTTTLLESWAGTPMRVGDVALRVVRPELAPRGVVALLGTEGEVLVRHSTLTDAGGRRWSWNRVVAGPGGDPALRRCLTDAAVPLGPALRAAGARLERTVVRAGVTPWPPEPRAEEPRPAAFRTYRLWRGDDVLAAVHEVFNPAHVPADLEETA
ncbi:hypothetical protein AA958_17215 [Streptomyces sp. CNQ-509]|uniref:hypothetical protein n=1 Tax=unclassified Streptomyces TaxID=2593676 RepID=UPI00062DF862|nr:hypothetical protein [Streptomyces sp. CNQ-509]AKH83661.1 hypothetical protein AA958_17215 [Streptomyces sp. CNQ-509]